MSGAGVKSVEQPSAVRSLTAEDARILRGTRLRLMALSGVVTLFILVGLGATVYTAASSVFTNDSVSRLKSYADTEFNVFSRLVTGTAPPTPRNIDPEFGTRNAGIFFVCLDSDQTMIYWTKYLPPGMPVASGINAVAKGGSDVREVNVGTGAPLRVYTEAVALPNGMPYVIQTATDTSEEVNFLAMLRLVLILGGAGALLAAVLAGYLYAGRALIPIRQSIERRQAALQRQREFAANASHELRTPLTVIGASVEDLKRNRRSKVEDVGEAIGDIDAEVRHMTALVEDMLLLARTDSGVVQVERVPLDLGDIAAESASMLATLGQERGVQVVLDPLPAPVVGDPLRLRQLVTILVDNAIRHSPAGSTVEARVRPAAGGAEIQVDDGGPGIKPDDLPRIFERFWRADDAPAGGTGLGLAIAKWIVEQHGGRISAANRSEGGASFSVWLPSRHNRSAGDSVPSAGIDEFELPEESVPPDVDLPPAPPSV
jgi:signal transduction histidine kinase